MTRFLVRRLVQGVVVVLAASAAVLALTSFAGDPAVLLLPPEASETARQQFREVHRLDDPFVVQYFHFVGGILRGDFANSFSQGVNALTLVTERIPATFLLTTAGMLVAAMVSIPIATAAAVKRGGVVDQLARLLAMIGQMAPGFFIGLILIRVFAVNLRWLPATGSLSWKGLVLPAITVAIVASGQTIRLFRSSLLDVLDQEYMRAATARGLGRFRVIGMHAYRNAALPVLTLWGLQFGTLMGRAMVVETVFGFPGMGMLAYRAVSNRDLAVVQAFVIVVAAMVVVVNLVLDLVYALVDPRLRRLADSARSS